MSEMLEFMFKLDVAMSNGFSQPARAMQGEMQKLMNAGQQMQSRLGKVNAYDQMRSKLQASERNLEGVRNAMTRAGLNVNQSRERTAVLASQYESARKRVQEWSQTMPRNSMMLQTARRRADELKKAYQESQTATKNYEREYENLYRKVGEGSAALDSERAKLSEISSEMKRAGIDTNNLAREQEKLKTTMDRLSSAQSKMQRIRETLSYGNLKETFMKTTAAVMPLKPMVKISGDFEEAMQKVKAVGFSSEGADLTQFNEMKAQALRLGAETSFTAIQAANAQENLIRAGFTPDETMKAMPGLLNMAAAEGLDLAQAATIVAGSIRSIGLAANDAEKIADMFAFASANSATNIANIGEAFAGTAGTARGLKVEAEQLTAMLMSLANQQVEASQAGTAMSSTFMRLSKEPKAVADALAKYKVAIMTRNGDMRELPDILAELYKNTERFGSKSQIGAFANVFGANFGDAMFKLAQASLPGKNGELSEYEQNLKNIREKSKGQSQRMTDINLDSLNGQLTILGSAIDGVKIALGDMFNPLVRQGVELLTNALSGLNRVLLEFPVASKTVVMTLTALAGMKAASSVLSVGRAILSLPAAWLEYSRALRAASALTGEKVSMISGLFNALLHPVAALKSAFMALWGVIAAHPFMAIITACSLIYAYWDEIKAMGLSTWQSVKEAGEKFLSWWNTLNFAPLWENLKAVGLSAWGAIKSAGEKFLSWWNSIDFRAVWENLKASGLSTWQSVKEAGEKFLAWWNSISLSDIWQSVIDGFNAMLNYLTEKWQSFKDFFSSLNPMNWFSGASPEQLAVQQKAIQSSPQGQNAQNIAERYSSAYKPYASGGILTTPHLGLVAEAGPEAIVPLRDKARGQEVLMQAANILGMNMNSDSPGIIRLSEGGVRNEYRNVFSSVSDRTDNDVANRFSNVINIQVDGRNQDDMNLAQRIAGEIRNVLSEIASENVRLNYA